MAVTATVTVSFADPNKGGTLTAELDTRDDGYNQGRSQFAHGDEPVFLVRHSDDLEVQVFTSTGSCASFDNDFTQEQDFLSYVQTRSASTSKPITGGLVTTWLGNNLGAVRQVGSNELAIAGTTPITGVGVLKVNFNSAFTAYRLTGVPATLNGETNFNVLVAFVGVPIED